MYFIGLPLLPQMLAKLSLFVCFVVRVPKIGRIVVAQLVLFCFVSSFCYLKNFQPKSSYL